MRKHLPFIVGMFLVVVLLAFSFGVSKAQEAGPSGRNFSSPDGVTASSDYIPIQGRLTDAQGNPLDGNFNLRFSLYEAISGGSAVCSDTIFDLPVKQGLFNTYMNMGGCTELDGRQLYLGVQVGSDPEMTPRHPIDNVPSAWTLRPGAEINGAVDADAVLDIDNTSSTGRGLRVEAKSTTGVNYAVVGGARSAEGYGGYFYNNGGGVGLEGISYSASAPGIIAHGTDYGADLILDGNADTAGGDDGRLTSDPDYASSDLIFTSNDTVRIDLDNDGDGEDADFEIYDKDNALIFDVDESGAVTSGGEGIAAFPRPAYDSGWIPVDHGVSVDLYHNLGGNIENYVVDMTCQSATIGINNFGSGGDYNDTEFYGAYWRALTTTYITIVRLNNDVDCGHVRVRIWMYP
jgi:hypothetical protein